jgi:hypothetical protein
MPVRFPVWRGVTPILKSPYGGEMKEVCRLSFEKLLLEKEEEALGSIS